MPADLSVRQMSSSEREAKTEASRVTELMEDALAVVAIPSEIDSLESIADRIERAARDLSAALRELAHQRRTAQASD